MNWTRKDWAIVIAVTLLAMALRLYKLGEVPPGFQFDEAFNAIDAQQVLDGNRPLFLPANAGREVLYTYWQAIVITAYGFFTGSGTPINAYTLRLASSLGGITLIPLIYTFLRFALRRDSQIIATCVAVAQAISMWHIHFSHFGIRVVLMPVMFTLAFGIYWIASSRLGRWRQIFFYIGAGIATGLTVWNHPTGRFAPFVLIGYTLWLWVIANKSSADGEAQSATGNGGIDTGADAGIEQNEVANVLGDQRQQRQNALVGLVVAGVAAFIIFLPLGLEFLERPDFFFSHASDSSFLNEEVSQGAPWRTLGLNFVKVAGMFNISGDRDWTHNLPGRPVFDPLMSIAFLIGLFLWGKRIADPKDADRDLLVMLMIWLLVMLFPSILSNDAPDYSRTMPAHPALMLAPGLGLAWLWGSSRNWSFPWAGPALVAGIVLFSGVMAFRDYFIDFASRTELYYAYDVDKLDTLTMLADMTDGNSVYLSRLWADHATPTFLRGQSGIQSIETSGTLVLPPQGKGAVYAFPHEQAERADDLLEIFPTAMITNVLDPQGQELLHIVSVDADDLAEWPPEYEPTFLHQIGFDDGPTLLGMRPRTRDGSLLLFWTTEKKMLRDLTSFVHLLDERGNKVGQIDRSPGSGTYRTPVWEPGERIMDRYWPTVTDPCAGDSVTRAVVGWYQLADEGRRRSRTDGVGELALAGRIHLPARAYPAGEIIPEIDYAVDIDSQTRLVGYTVAESNLEPGARLTLEFVWEAVTNVVPESQSIALSIENETESYPLWNSTLAQVDGWTAGQRVCRRFVTRIPIDVEAGIYQLGLTADDGPAIALGELTVAESTRTFSVPEGFEAVDARLTDSLEENAIIFRGFELTRNDRSDGDSLTSLSLTLAWQADSVIYTGYSAFVHLLDAENQIVTQSDAIPGGVQTDEWVPGEVVLDTHELVGELDDGFRIVVGLYDPLTGRRMNVKDGQGQTLPENSVELILQE